MGGSLGNKADAVKHYKKSEHKWMKYLKDLNKQNKILYSIAKKSVSLCELKKIKNIEAKNFKKCRYSSSNFSRIGSDFDSSLSSDSDLYEERKSTECK